MPDTLYLDPESWDLEVDAYGNIALASTPYAQAQDAASACRLWKGEARYDAERGIPYPSEVLGQQPPPRVLAGWFEIEAETVPGVGSTRAVLQYEPGRRLGGQIQLTLEDGSINALTI